MWHRIDDPDNPPPKDGTRFLVWGGRFISELEEDGYDNDKVQIVTSRGSYFPLAETCYYSMSVDGPTHWMPAPPPPAEDTP